MKKIAFLIISIVLLNINSIAQTWSMVGKGIQSQKKDDFNTIYALEIYKDELYAAGSFTIAGGVITNYIAKWDGTNWSEVGSGTNGLIFAMKVYKDELYAGGWFTTAGGESASYIAKWNGSGWSPVGGGMDFHPNCLEVYKDELYVGGEFTKAGGKPVRNIAKWNGTEWSTPGKGQDVTMRIGVYKENLFTGGYAFDKKNNFFIWNGSSWVGNGYDLGGLPNSMIVYKDEFYVGGYFPKHGKVVEMSITRFDGKNWSVVGKEGTNGHVYSMLVLDNELYCGGFFTSVDGISTNNMAKWNGSVWSSFTPGLGCHPHSLVVYKGNVYAAGGYERSESGIIGKEMIMKMPLADFKNVSK